MPGLKKVIQIDSMTLNNVCITLTMFLILNTK